MTKDDLIRFATETNLPTTWIDDKTSMFWPDLKRFADLVAAHEREECAKLADEQLMNTSALMSMPPKSSAAWNIAAAIRARGKA